MFRIVKLDAGDVLMITRNTRTRSYVIGTRSYERYKQIQRALTRLTVAPGWKHIRETRGRGLSEREFETWIQVVPQARPVAVGKVAA